MLKKYLGLSEVEIAENEKMWLEERDTGPVESGMQGNDLRNVGVTPGGINTDMETLDDIEAQAPEAGAELPTGEVGAGGTAGAQPGAGSTGQTAPPASAGAT